VRLTGDRRREFIAAARGLPRLEDVLALPRQRLDVARSSLANGIRRQIADRRQHLALLQSRMPRLRDLAILPRRRLDELSRRLERSRGQGVRDRRAALDRAGARLKPVLVAQRLAVGRRTVVIASQRVAKAHAGRISQWRASLDQSGKLLGALSYAATLSRGYALARDTDGKVIRSTDAAISAGGFGLSFADGQVAVAVTDSIAGTGSPSGKTTSGARKGKPDDRTVKPGGKPKGRSGGTPGGGQGSLF
jgi:exodeoxyribonuclease VII large subunit